MQRQFDRVPHIMKRHISNRMPSSLLFFDTETKTLSTPNLKNISRQSLKFGYAYRYRMENGCKTREKWCRFTTAKQFFKFALDASDVERPVYCFAHNLGFDLTILDFWRWTETANFQVDYFVLQDPPTFIIGRHDGRKLIFIDTLNYWRQSLAKIGESIGLPKLDMPGPRATEATWNRYGRRDVEILALAVEKLIAYVQDNDLGQFGLSAASMAMSTYKHKFMKHDIFIHADNDVLQLERNSYYGGFTNCFYVGKVEKQTTYKLDVNSMYPYVMLGYFPVKMICRTKQITSFQLRDQLYKYGAVAHISINSIKHTYPVYEGDKLCFCRGRFETTLAGPELIRAFNNGDISGVHHAAFYEMAPIFNEYIKYFWKERQRFKAEGNEVNQIFVKLFMNMLYGKFGQMGYDSAELTTESLERIYKHYGKEIPDTYKDAGALLTDFIAEVDWQPIGLGRPLTLRKINNAIQIKIPLGEHSESFPAIAAYVTSYARELLWTYIRAAGEHSVYYCDTDSLFVDRKGYERLNAKGLVSSSDIGLLKLEKTADSCEFWCPKDYRFGDETTIKGIRKNAEKISDTEFKQVQFEGIKSVLRRGYEPYIDVETITKKNTRKFTKGTIGPDGWVIPFMLPLEYDSTLLD